MKRLILILVSLTLSCSTKRTPYAPLKDGEGYADKENKVTFKGNEATKTKDAEILATFRAIEICQRGDKKLTHILDLRNRTKKKDIIRSSGTGYNPSYYYGGMSPFYGRYSGFGMGIGMSSGTAWKETLVYPDIEVTYECSEKVWGPRVIFRDVSAENMKLLVKDLKGGLQVEKILPDSPNEKFIEVGDIVTKVDGVRVEKSQQIQKAFNQSPLKNTLSLEILREGVKLKVNLTSADITNDVRKCQEDMIKLACAFEELKKNTLCK